MRLRFALNLDIISDESGQDLVEYALAAALVGLALVGCLNNLATQIVSGFSFLGSSITSSV